jgi:glycosyltransferase involved in cell wall biosynthesis
MMHAISVVIPTYNRARLVTRALESVFAQTASPREVIVVDDGSTDDTLQRLGSLGGRIRVIPQANAGGAAARNRGVHAATADWVAFLDSDDVWTPGHLERITAAVTATGGEADLYFDDMEHQTPAGSESRWRRAGFAIEPPHLCVNDATAWAMLEHQPMMLQTSVVKRTRMVELGGFWERLRTAHDTHMFFRICIGRPACAVAGTGAVQTDDDVPENRLTIRSGVVKLGRWRNTALLHADILSQYPQLSEEYRKVLRRRVSAAHWRLSRIAWQNGDVGESLRSAALSIRGGPTAFVGALVHGRHGAATAASESGDDRSRCEATG